MSPRVANATAGALLGFLLAGPASGWDLLRTARVAVSRFWTITSSQVYRELAAMERDGLVEAGQSGPRERRPYTITEAGRAAFEEWLRRPPGDEQIRSPLLLTLSFGRHLPPAALAAFITEQRETHAARLDGYLKTLEAVDPRDLFVRATLDYGIRYERAVLDWFDALPAALTAG